MYSRSLVGVFLTLLSTLACSSQQSVGEAWHLQGAESRADMARENKNPVHWQEIHSFWLVAPDKVDAAIDALAKTSAVPLTKDEALGFLSSSPSALEDESLFLIRGINAISHPIAIKVYESAGVVNVFSGTSSTCFFFRPRVRAQPLVVALKGAPSRVILGVSCDG